MNQTHTSKSEDSAAKNTANNIAGQKMGRRVAFIQACWHRDIVDQARDSFAVEIKKHCIDEDRIDYFEVPGGFEIPLQAKRLSNSGKYGAIVAAALVVDGGIYRHEFVASAVIDALMSVQLETNVPIISSVLTPQNFHEHEDHRTFFLQHFRIKGAEAASVCANMMKNDALIDGAVAANTMG
jgi:6,7-dimethyl-8-ribityllumazine synthase